jgi:signal transduction histidine kinase
MWGWKPIRLDWNGALHTSGYRPPAGTIVYLHEAVYCEEQAKRLIQTEAAIARHRALAQMVAGVAHELNTPLGIANTTADIGENGEQPGIG